MTGIPKSWCIFFFALALLVALSTCFAATVAESAFRSVICPPDWRATVSQRYDRRDEFGWIVKRTWIARCY